MTIRNVKDNLTLLDISSISQLDSNNINYWWEEKYLSIKYDDSIPNDKKNELLVSINEARDNLNKIEIKIIKQILNENKKDFNREKEKVNPKSTKITPIETWWFPPLAYALYRLVRTFIENN